MSAPKLTATPGDATPVRDAVVFIHRAAIRPVIRQELKNAGVVNIVNVDSLDECVGHMVRLPLALLVLDWDHGVRAVNSILAAAQAPFKIDTRPIFLIASEVSLDIVATGTEYNVSRIHTGEISRGAIQEHIEWVIDEESDQRGFRPALARVAEAQSTGDFKAASQQLLELNRRFPDNRRISCELADTMIALDRWDQAAAVAEQLSVTDRHNLRAQHIKARCLMHQGDFAGAAAILKATQLINPFNVDRLVDLGKALLNDGQVREALGSFDAALAIDKADTEARKGRVTCKLIESDVNEALALLRQMQNPREIAALFNNSAILAIRQTRFDQGLVLYRTAIGAVTEPRLTARLVFNLGIAFHKWGRLDEALECFERATTLDKLFEKARHNAAAVASRLGRRAAVDAQVEEDFADMLVDEKPRG
jgi:tetratricopeptide (TPR) repeat protein